MNEQNSFPTLCFLIQTIDPVHIGTGGMRLGRVDNSIVREPGTKLPKIPGTSLSGAIRSYASYRYGKRSCSGKDGHCGHPTCPICYTFGSISGKEENQKSFAGVVSIGDARILLFPVYSMAGPVWVTSPSTLVDFGVKENLAISNDKAKMASGLKEYKNLNLGWLMVEKEGDLLIIKRLAKLPETVKNRIVLVSDKLFSQVVNSSLEVRTSVSIDPETGAAESGALFTYEAIPRAAFLWMDLVVDDYRSAFPSYSTLVQWQQTLSKTEGSNEDSFKILKKIKFLSNYNDFPKNSSKYFENDFKEARVKLLNLIDEEIKYYEKATLPSPKCWKNKEVSTTNPQNSDTSIETSADVVAAGLEWAEHLGIGGMGTRGFGRIRGLKL
jgi:CRISPR-associated protein Cmr4